LAQMGRRLLKAECLFMEAERTRNCFPASEIHISILPYFCMTSRSLFAAVRLDARL
jgi:hypothetical protein